MTNEYVLDAHALVWFLEGNPKTASPASLLSCDHDIIASGLVPIVW